MIRFKDKEKEKQFYNNGYVVIDILSDDEIAQLKKLYFNHKEKHLSNKETTHSTCDTNNPDLIKYIDKEVAKILLPKAKKVLYDFDYMLSVFLTKEPGSKNTTGFHQDPTLIDKENAVSANIWIPLQDVNADNGCLRFIKGSHKFGNLLVVTPDFPTFYEKFENNLSHFETQVFMKAGQGIVFDNKIIHGATANHLKTERLAIVSVIKSAGCDWVYYYMDKEKGATKIEKYVMDYENYVRYPKGRRPQTKLIGEISHKFEQASFVQFLRFMAFRYPFETFRKLFKII